MTTAPRKARTWHALGLVLTDYVFFCILNYGVWAVIGFWSWYVVLLRLEPGWFRDLLFGGPAVGKLLAMLPGRAPIWLVHQVYWTLSGPCAWACYLWAPKIVTGRTLGEWAWGVYARPTLALLRIVLAVVTCGASVAVRRPVASADWRRPTVAMLLAPFAIWVLVHIALAINTAPELRWNGPGAARVVVSWTVRVVV